MKKIFYIIGSVALIVLLSTNFLSCVDQDFEDIAPRIDTTKLVANTTIVELKSMYAGSIIKLNESTFFHRDSIIIEGVITSDDSQGNFYKSIVIQDGTAAIELKLEKTNLFLEYKRGQKVVVLCNDLYLGDYGGLIQLGSIYTENGVTQMGGLQSEGIINRHLFKKSSKLEEITPLVVDRSTLLGINISKLVEIRNVQFDSLYYPGTQIVLPFADKVKKESLDHPLQGCTDNYTTTDSYGNVKSILVVRTSGFATFANNQIPTLKGNIRGILSFYNGTFQIIIRDLDDIDFTLPRCN